MKKGFTLIELLIVIAVLGILAAGILATIDPFEQFKKARDTNARNTVVEIYNAFVRFNANHGEWPWSTAPTDYATQFSCSQPSGTNLSSLLDNCISGLVEDGELKAGFTQGMQGGNAITTATVTFIASPSETVAVCFKPDSKTITKDANTKFDSTGAATCTVGTGDCYWCAQ